VEERDRNASDLLERAIAALRTRGHFSAFPELPSGKIYGEGAREEGQRAFEAHLERPFRLDQPTSGAWLGGEESPYGFPLGIRYPAPDPDGMIKAALSALPRWRDCGVERRAEVCLDILERLNRRSFELAYAVMHTTGQGFVMAFQAGGPHAQDRGLEALACAVDLMRRTPARALWEKRVGRDEVARFDKRYRIAPRGLALVIGCSTFPTWNSYPALFADLATGNPVLVKPHPRAVLPLALTVQIARQALDDAGFDPNLVQLVVDSEGEPIAKSLATRPEVRLIDFTGSSAFGNWLEQHCPQAAVFTEKSGVNSVVVDSTDDFRGMVRNLAFSLSLYAGQMCTTPQNIFVPASGIATDQGHKGFEEVAGALVEAVDRLLADPKRAVEVLGCIQNPATVERIDRVARAAGSAVLRPSAPLVHPEHPKARVHTPLLVQAESGEEELYLQELFGPIAFVIEADSTADAIARAAKAAREKGAITASVYSTREEVLADMERAMLECGVALSENLTGGVYVNQSAAFSDFHATGLNPAANASLVDEAFVAPRFHVVQLRRPLGG